MDFSEMNQQYSTSATPASTHIVYLALGANIGDRQGNIKAALQRLDVAVKIEMVSSIYETEPVGYLDQPRFLNLACRGTTILPPHDLLTFVKQIESDLGRQPAIRNGPRPIDIDILLYDDLRIEYEDLVIPHPRMIERAFVLVPLAEIAPAAVEPVSGKPIRELAQTLLQQGIIRLMGEHHG
jgi:2-amino-4-hydroxy-6-hydroxymethyldihydropteridine diphosphokinase